MTSERELVRRLRDALAEADLEVDDLVEEAWSESREEVRSTLRRLMTRDLLARTAGRVHRARPGSGTDSNHDPPAASRPAAEDPEAHEEGVPERSTYLFGVGDARLALPRPEPGSIPGGGPVRLIPRGSVSAVVCHVDSGALARLNDPGPASFDLLAETARAHDGVLGSLAATEPVLPLKLGTVVADDATAFRLLEANEPDLRRELDRMEGHAEWAVTVWPVDAEAEDGESARSAHPASASGREYLESRRDALRERGMRRAEHHEAAGEIHQALAACAAEAQRVTDRPVEESPPPLLHGVYLVRHAEVEGFRSTARELERQRPRAAVHVSGPCPPLPLHQPEPDGSAPVRASAAKDPPNRPESMDPLRAVRDDDATVVDLLDRLLEGGVMIHGDVTLSLAGVDLLYVGLRLVVKVPDDGSGP